MLPEPKLAKWIDDLMQADILGWRDWLFTWLLRSTKAVTAGLVLEGPELFHDISWLVRHWCFRRKFHFSLPAQHAPEWAKVLAFVGWILITVGVAGEWYTEAHIEEAGATIQSFMNARFEDAENKSSALSLRASVNEMEAQQLKSENLKLEAVIAPRRLTPKQAGELESLTQFSGKTVDIRSYANDAEGFLLGSQILDALSKAHIGIADNRFTKQASTEVLLGVSVEGGDKTLVAKLHAILSENGLDTATTISRGPAGMSTRSGIGGVQRGPTVAEITVGMKPIKQNANKQSPKP